jgi:serine/alanine racemase
MRVDTNYHHVDRFKIVAALMVVAIHTGPLTTYSENADFLLTRIVCRLAVPFFFMAAGFFLFRKLDDPPEDRQTVRRYVFRLGVIYAFSMVLYLPLNLYAGHLDDMGGVFGLFKMIVFDGTFYHLWYLPAAMIGVYVVYFLWRMLSTTSLLAVTGLLYVIGLLGDSYFGLVEQNEALSAVYACLFQWFDYTRNGLFFAPIFLALGLTVAKRAETARSVWFYIIGFVVSLGFMFVEGVLLKHYNMPRHDSMYVFLVPAVYFLFQWLLVGKGRGGGVYLRHISLWLYILHPLAIVLVRGAAKLLDLTAWLVANSLVHYTVVTCLSLMLSMIAVRILYDRPKQPDNTYRAWKELNMDNLEHNLLEIRRVLADECQVMAVVKADAYGHGSVPVARKLEQAGVKYFAVAEIEEGITLRKHGVKGNILILGHTCKSRFGDLVKYRLQQTVVDADYAQMLNQYGKPIEVHIKIDTGMNRLGERFDHRDRILSMYRQPHLRVIGTYTHLCASDRLEEEDIAYTHLQIRRFEQVIKELKAVDINPGILHIQSSYGIMNYPDLNYGLARPGIALYGVRSHLNQVRDDLKLRPVLSLRARVIAVKDVAKGESIGYGTDGQTMSSRKIAVVGIGYADGVPREYAKQGQVLVRGESAKIIGKICMDQLLIDVTHIDGVKPQDIVTIIGQDGKAQIMAEQMAEQCGTITNEILSRIGRRVECVIRS